MEMHGKTNSIHLGIEILTPVQCGSGQELFKKLDYVEKDHKVFIVDQAQSFNEVASNDADTNNLLMGGKDLSDLVELAGYFGYSLPMFSRSSKVPEKIREHLKDAHDQPYIPGSSLKGAIRSALIAWYLRSLSDTNFQRLLPNATDSAKDKKGKHADNKLLEHLLGKEPKQDIFRALHVKDAMFKTGDLCLVDVRWLNLTGNADRPEVKWRSITAHNSFSEWHDADGIYAEMLTPKSQASFQLQWDEFLLSDLSRWHGAANDILPRTLEDLRTRLNAHANYRLQQEIDFYYAHCKYGKRAPAQECEILQKHIKDDPDSIYLQLSWGSGWRGMTGDWMDDGLELEMRELYNLDSGRRTMPFPKTRRLAVSGEPKLPLGWIRLFPYIQIEEKLELNQAQKAEQWLAETIAALKTDKDLKGQTEENLWKKPLSEKWLRAPGELKQPVLELIKSKWKDFGISWEQPKGQSAESAKRNFTQ